MFNSKCWRQPIPSDINNFEVFTAVERAVFREILSLCQNNETLLQFTHNDKHYQVLLQRGQCIFKVSNFAKDFGIDRKRVRRSIKNISKWYSQMDSKAMPYGLVITVHKYDEITKMDNQMHSQRTVKGQSKDSQRTPNKTVKTVETVETVEKNISNDKSLENITNETGVGLIEKDKLVKKDNAVIPYKEMNKQIGECIKHFESLNPSYKVLYNRKTQREAMQELIQQYGYEKILKMIDGLPSIINDKFAPTITTPYQLREKMGSLKQYVMRNKSKKGGVVDVYE